jgi:hypothetical protein
MERNQFLEEIRFTFSYSPLPDDEGGIGGGFCACQRVLSQRRLRTLSALAERATQAKTAATTKKHAAKPGAGKKSAGTPTHPPHFHKNTLPALPRTTVLPVLVFWYWTTSGGQNQAATLLL